MTKTPWFDNPWPKEKKEKLMDNPEDLPWDEAKDYLDEIRSRYEKLSEMENVNVIPVLQFTIDPLVKRYRAGERTEELYNEIMSLE